MHLWGGKFVSLTRKSLIALVAAAVVLALLALPGNAAPEKQFSLRFPTSLSAGTQTISVPLKNETPNGNSNINSFRITAATAPAGFTINSITPGTGVLSNSNKTISVTGISTLKPQQTATYTLSITVPNVGCSGGTITWTGQAFTGNSLNGDPFRLHNQTEASPSQLTTSISTGCTTISVNKYEDANANTQKDTGEGAPTQSFSFDLKQGTTTLQTKSTNGSGVATFDPVSTGAYTVCESTPLPTGWHNTDPGGTGCKSVTASGATASVTFGNAEDITINVNKFQDSNLNGTQQSGEPGLDGWDFTLDDAAAGTTANGGALSITASPGDSHTVCEVPQDGWFSTTGGDCQTIAAADASSGSTVSLDFGNAHGELGCTTADNTINVSGGDNDPATTISGVRLENKDGSECIKIPYVFSENPADGEFAGGFTFTKDNSVQPQAQFLITQDVVRDTVVSNVTGLDFTSNTINGYTTQISYNGGSSFQPVPICPIVHRDGQGNITGAELPGNMNTGYCIADQAAHYGDPTASQVTIHTVLYGFGDPITRTRPI
jgi:hypothetical protein